MLTNWTICTMIWQDPCQNLTLQGQSVKNSGLIYEKKHDMRFSKLDAWTTPALYEIEVVVLFPCPSWINNCFCLILHEM